MYSLCYGLYKRYTARPSYTLLILGLDNAGKTSFFELARMTPSLQEAEKKSQQSSQNDNGSFSKPGFVARAPRTMPTIGLNVGTVDLPDSKAQLTLWDLGGQSGLRPLWDYYFNEAHAVTFLVDAADVDRIPEVQRELSKLIAEPQLSDAPIIILANKRDLPQALSPHDLAKQLNIAQNRVTSTDTSPSPAVTTTGNSVTIDLDSSTDDDYDTSMNTSRPLSPRNTTASGAPVGGLTTPTGSESRLPSTYVGYWPGTDRVITIISFTCAAGLQGGILELLVYLKDLLPTLSRTQRMLSEKETE